MAPITASVTGVTPQKIQDERLAQLLESLRAIPEDSADLTSRIALCVDQWQEWVFEEQVDLHDWISPLNLMDKALRQALVAHPQILLVSPIDRKKGTPKPNTAVAESVDDLQTIPDALARNLQIILLFEAGLVRNSTSKAVYASVDKMADFLGAADDDLADAALSVLKALAVPADLYKQQAPDSGNLNGASALHTSKTQCHARLTACAVGWGTRAQGLGLEAVVTADDASDPPEAGFLDFGFYETSAEDMSRIRIEPLEIFKDKDDVSMEEGSDSSASKKRRRVMETKSTAELFFLALQKAGGRAKIPEERLFSLLADIRLARCFHSRALRLRAVERRLKALVSIIHAHPSQEVMTGYFQAQPELCVEIVDLLRPTISSAHVSANSANPGIMRHHDAVAGLAQGTSIPPQIQALAVETLTALVCRRDGSTDALSGKSRTTGVFLELGIGKGQYMGVLPTLVRYSLAALTAEAPTEVSSGAPDDGTEEMDFADEIGVAFVQATMAPLPPRPQLVMGALELIEHVLTLTSMIVSNPSGASALTEGGLVPSVLNVISLPSETLVQRLLGPHKCSADDVKRVQAKVRFVTAQVLQIVEASVVTHGNALTAFHDLHGVDALVSRLAKEIGVSEDDTEEDAMDTDETEQVSLHFSQCVLLYGLFTCLTVVFHQEPSTSLSALSAQTGSSQLRKPVMTRAVKKVMENIGAYGGHIAYLVATLLADVMNNDPQIVRHVHSSGVAQAFLSMLNSSGEPVLPAVGDLITALPNVISALALTEDGAQAVFDANPFPGLLSVYHHPKYAMPQSRCLLNDNTSFIGTGLEEVIRHVDKLKPQVIEAVVGSLQVIKEKALELLIREAQDESLPQSIELVDARSALIQYVLNAGQLLEQILHNEDNVVPFVDAGGLDAVLDLYRSSLPRGVLFLAHVSALSSPSVSTLHHSTIEDILFVSLRCIVSKYDPVKLTRKLAKLASEYLDDLEESRKELLGPDETSFVLDRFPRRPLHEIDTSSSALGPMSSFLWHSTCVQWISCCLGMSMKSIIRKGEDAGSSSRRIEREWRKELASESFTTLLERLADFHYLSVLDVCRIRGGSDFDEREMARLSSKSIGVKFRIRIVCPEGAIVRDGIEIDSCASVGSMSMGEVADAYDRCINSSGILRYRTPRGWVSEMTRGHGREPISEVISIYKSDEEPTGESTSNSVKRLENAVADLQTVGCGVLARLQSSHHEIIGALSKVAVQSLRQLDTGSMSFEEGSNGGVVKVAIKQLADMSKRGFALLHRFVPSLPARSKFNADHAGSAMYLGFMLDTLYACLFDEKRERRIVNLPLLINLVSSNRSTKRLASGEAGREDESPTEQSPLGFLEAIELLFEHCLTDFEDRASFKSSDINRRPILRVRRSVASTFATVVKFIRRLISTPISVSPLASILSRLKLEHIPLASGDENLRPAFLESQPSNEFFEPEHFARGLNVCISRIIHQFWTDHRLQYAPPYLMHPVTGLVGEVIISLEGSGKKKMTPTRPASSSRGQLLSDWIRDATRQEEQQREEFEPSEDAIQGLHEMGFSRDHAIEALERTGSNQVEVAMEYALQHPPPSPSTVERRRTQRSERQRRREEAQRLRSQSQSSDQETGDAERQSSTSTSGGTGIKEDGKDESGERKPQHDDYVVKIQDELVKWVDSAASVSCGILTQMRGTASAASRGDGDAETEAMTVVLCSFLFDLCHRFPEKRKPVIKSILDEIKSMLGQPEEASREGAISALCHAVVLFARALPKTRLMILKCCLVEDVLSLVAKFTSEKMSEDISEWPLFLPPSILLLEVMSQPVVGFGGKDPMKALSARYTSEESLPLELGVVFRQHRQQREKFSRIATVIFGISTQDATTAETDQVNESEDTASSKPNLFDAIPSFFPLLPEDCIQTCVEVCKKILGGRSKGARVPPPPGVTHAALLLLLQLLRSPSLSSECLRDGLADDVVSIPASCRFTGNAGLVTLVLRRLLEDEASLQGALESEIKSTLAKIQAKDKDKTRSDKAQIELGTFLEAVTPLICRDQMSFLRAMSLTVKLEPSGSKGSVVVRLLDQQERLSKGKAIQDLIPGPKELSTAARVEHKSTPNGKRRQSSGGNTKGKSPGKSSRRLSAKKLKGIPHGSFSPASSICSLLINGVLRALSLEQQDHSTNKKVDFFLSAGELLDILADLTIAVSACSAVVHNYRPFKSKEKSLKSVLGSGVKHAIPGSTSPPKSFVNFLLHYILAQDRWRFRQDPQLWERKTDVGSEDLSLQARKRHAYRLAKTTQGAGRVLAALAARPGEGRKRVIEDLVFALSGGRLGHGTSPSYIKDNGRPNQGSAVGNEDSSMSGQLSTPIHALQTWGELCLGLIGPRGNGKTIEGSSSIRVENVKLMLECGMVHSLLFALHCVPLAHPMAASTCEALLLPMEVLIRPAVSSAVRSFAESGSTKPVTEENDRTDDVAPAGGVNGIAYEELVQVESQDGRGIHTTGDGHRRAALGHAGSLGEPEGEMDVEFGNGEASSESGMSHDEGEQESSGDDDSESGIDDDGAEDDDEEVEEDSDDESSSDMDDPVEIHSDAIDETNAWDTGNGDLVMYQGAENPYGYDEVHEDGTGIDQGIDEGWTRIDSAGFGGMFLGGSRRGQLSFNGANPPEGVDERNRGFIDAAEVMIGSLLRTGDISSDALAEIEGTLGVRISQGGRASRLHEGVLPGDGRRDGASNESPFQNRASGDRREAIGTVPHIHQRTQPEIGYSFVGNSGRLFEVSSLEYVYGGPSVTSGSRNYDIVTPIQDDEEGHDQQHLTQFDLQLFPGGPGTINGGRIQVALHPLLCGVDLPPMNAVISDLLPHGVRARRPGLLTIRRPGEWSNPSLSQGGYLVSTSTGNIVRSNRSHSWAPLGAGLPNRDASGPVGWTEDGLPFDASVGDLTSALRDALTASAPLRPSTPVAQQATDTGQDDIGDGLSHDPDAETSSSQHEGQVAPGQMEEAEDEPMTNMAENSESATDGDQVASSLAVGLRLSVDSEVNQEQVDNGTNIQGIPSTVNDSGNVVGAEASQDDSPPPPDNGGEPGFDTEPELARGLDASTPNENGLVCPPDIDPEVFASLPLDMQQDVVSQHATTQELAAQVEGTSIDPDFLAELPEEIRNDILEQQRREREARQQSEAAPADPSRAEAMDNASFLASLEPGLREEILLTADESFLSSLPPNIRAEAEIVRERATIASRRVFPGHGDGAAVRGSGQGGPGEQSDTGRGNADQGSGRRRQRSGKVKVDVDRESIVYLPESFSPPIAKSDIELLTTFLFLLSPVRPPRLMQQLAYSISTNELLRTVITNLFVSLLHDDYEKANDALSRYGKCYEDTAGDWRGLVDKQFSGANAFPPKALIGAAPDMPESDPFNLNVSASLLRRKNGLGTAASVAANLPKSSGGPNNESTIPSVVAGRILDILLSLCKNSPRFCLHMLRKRDEENATRFEILLDLLALPSYYKSAANLDHLLTLLESVVSPLSYLQRSKDDESEITQKDLDAALSSGKVYMDVPRVAVNQSRLKLLCSILRMETCRDSAFAKVNTIIRRLCRIEENRGYVLEELASVAHGLGTDAVRDLRSLRIRMEQTAAHRSSPQGTSGEIAEATDTVVTPSAGSAASSVALSTSTSELKLLRVLQALHSLCSDPGDEGSHKKHDSTIIVTEELLHLLRQMRFDDLWTELSTCLKVVHILEGVTPADEKEDGDADEVDDAGSTDDPERGGKKLRNSSAGLLSRFLPAIEAFLIANASATRSTAPEESMEGDVLSLDNLAGGKRLIEFVSSNRVLLNALVRNNANLLDKGLRALVQVPKCRQFLEFDVKRSWFKAQMRRLRSYASRRHGSLRIHIKRDRVFQEAYNYLRLRNAEEMRGRLHVTFQNEEGVDAGGLSREFFAILAKEMFNPGYALFTATEDGCTFQPNPNSGINPDHLSFFRFVGRIVGKALADGYLLDAHFTRSLYKHMLGMEPTHHDMEAIDPDYYRNLKTILEYKLEDIALDHLTFSITDNSFGNHKVVDLTPNGRSIPVTEENKEEYVKKVCQHRMTTAIQNQIKAYLDGFHELVNSELISIFTPRELELMISGLPDIDIDDLKKHTEYTGWRSTDKEITWFWKVMYTLSRDEKAKFLQFVTGSSKVPLAGFSELQGMRGTKKFTINKDSSGGSKGALMSAHTCFNTLDLPAYQSEEELKQKLLYAINEGTGAFLFA